MSRYHSAVRLLAAIALALLLVSLLGAAVAEVGNDTTHHTKQPGGHECFLAPDCSMATDCVRTCQAQIRDAVNTSGRLFGRDLPTAWTAELQFQPAVVALQKPPPKPALLS